MGFGEGVTQTIFFIAAITLATATVAMTYGALGDVGSDLATSASVAGQRLRSELRIINDPANVEAAPLTLLVKNVGAETLHPALFTVLFDGAAYTDLVVDVLGSADDEAMRGAEVASVEVTGVTPGSGDHTVRVVAETGAWDELQFLVT